MTARASIEFPYQFDNRFLNWFPVIPVRLPGREGRIVETAAYIDSGAAFSIFRVTEAVSLGLAGFFEHFQEVSFQHGRRKVVLTP